MQVQANYKLIIYYLCSVTLLICISFARN